MALVVFIAQECREDAEKHGLSSGLNNLKESVEQYQNLTGFAFFPPTPFVKKQIGRRFRLLGYRFPVGDDELVVFLRLLGRGSGEYEDFLENWDKDQDRITRQLQPYSHAQLQGIFCEKTRTSPPPPRPEPTAEERAWLYEVLRHNVAEDELLVLETEAWVKRMRSPENRDFIALYHQLIEQLGMSQLKPASSNSDLAVHWEVSKRIGLIYLYRPDLQRRLNRSVLWMTRVVLFSSIGSSWGMSVSRSTILPASQRVLTRISWFLTRMRGWQSRRIRKQISHCHQRKQSCSNPFARQAWTAS